MADADAAALDAFNEAVGLAILNAIDQGGADAVWEVLTTLAEVCGRDVGEYADDLMEAMTQRNPAT